MAVAFTRSETQGTEEATLFYANERDVDRLSIKDDGVRFSAERNRALFAWETRSLVRRRVLQVVIGVLGIAIIVFIILAFTLNANSETKYSCNLGTARVDSKEKRIDFKNAANQFVLSADVGLKFSSALEERHTKSKTGCKYVTSNGASLTLKQESQIIIAVNWTSSSKQGSTVFMDCFKLSGAHWYGGSELLWQEWPLEKTQVSMGRYLPQSICSSSNKSSQTFGPVLERYWLSSRGIAIVVDANVPLHVSVNANSDGKLCLKSDINGYLKPTVSYLGYRVLSGYNPRDLHLNVIEKFLGKPSGIPHETLIKKASWVAGKNLAAHLSDKDSLLNFSCGYIIIDGQYRGTLTLPGNSLKQINCNMSMKIHPYLPISFESEFSKAAKKGYLLTDCEKKAPGLITWNNSLAACVDLTRDSSKAWFKDKLLNLKVNSFEFHGGGVNHLPACYQFYNKSMDPGQFSIEYAKFAVSMNGLNVHVGHRTQKLPIFVRMSDKDSNWNGLKTIIPTVLTYGIMGYPYVLPSVVGDEHGNISKELYIRWLQINMFLPGVQIDFSKLWKFDQDTKHIVKDLLKLRSELSPIILDAFKNASMTGAPIIRPIWWVAPTDPAALENDSQFMLGDTYLVAPVLGKKAVNLSVYLPVGRWEPQFDKKQSVVDNTKKGKSVQYPVELTTVLYFKCLALYN